MPRKLILTPVLVPLLATGLLVQGMVPVVRVQIVYEALDQDMSAQIVAFLSTVFALLPVFLAVPMGRFNDRGSPPSATFLGGLALMAATALLWGLPPSLPVLIAASAILGVGQMLCISSLQVVVSICSSRAHKDAVLGNYMVATSLGHALGPLFVGLKEGIYPLAIGAAALIIGAAVLLIRAMPMRRLSEDARKVPLAEIARTEGLPWIVVTGAICVTALDLLLVFMPILGEARGLAPATVGFLLSLRAFASMLSRVIFGWAVRRFRRMQVMLVSVTVSGLGLVLLMLPLSTPLLAATLLLIGFGIGIAITSTIALTMRIAPPTARGTALSLRLTANKVAQVGFPLLAGLLVGPLGVGGIFALIGASLLAAPLAHPRRLTLSD